MPVNSLAPSACALSFLCNSMSFSKALGQGRRVRPVAGAIPWHTGKVLEAERGGCCLEGRKLLERHLDLQHCGLQVSFLPGAEQQHFLLHRLCPKDRKGRGAAPGRPPGEPIGQHELGVCLPLLLNAGSGTEGRCRHAQEEMGNKLMSLPCHMLCVYRMFGFLWIPCRDS